MVVYQFCLVDVSEKKAHIGSHIKLEGIVYTSSVKCFLAKAVGNVGWFVCLYVSPLWISLDQLSLATSH